MGVHVSSVRSCCKLLCLTYTVKLSLKALKMNLIIAMQVENLLNNLPQQRVYCKLTAFVSYAVKICTSFCLQQM